MGGSLQIDLVHLDRAVPITRRLRAMGIRDKPIAPGSPWQKSFAEKLIGSIRRECVDGRYSLLGPDFHRLDRTSLRLAHLLDQLVGDGVRRHRKGYCAYWRWKSRSPGGRLRIAQLAMHLGDATQRACTFANAVVAQRPTGPDCRVFGISRKIGPSMEHSRDDREHQCHHAGHPQYVARSPLLSHAGI